MPTIPFPNVPDSPGVPPVPRAQGASLPPIIRSVLSVAQGALWRAFQVNNRWGIFDSSTGRALADPRLFGGAFASIGGPEISTNALVFSKEMRVSDFPVERGGFASYNKVETPANPIVTLCMSGTEGDRSAFLAALDTAVKSTALYDVVTPEGTYRKYSLERYSLERRSNKGATLLAVDIALREVREVSAQFTTAIINKPQDEGSAPTVDNGKAQARTPDTSTLKGIANKLPGLVDRATAAIKDVLK